MLKKAALLVTALALSACGAQKLPQAELAQVGSEATSPAAVASEADSGAELIGPTETVSASSETGEEASPIGPTEEASVAGQPAEAALIGASESGSVEGAPETSYTLAATEDACPTINGSFVLTIGGEIRDRITIHTKRENGRLSYSFNNGTFYETQNKVHRSEQGALARASCSLDEVRLNYRDAKGSRAGRLEIVAFGEGQLKITNRDGRIATSGNYVAAE